ncbi:MAG: response regulator transcription factor [Chiayiivirga sp.]|jgi:DNA-binding response OmpR family regulator|uniref:response regulator transcription factor n=1 Tax=Chiayiivirga sp. TaxID=2041042 RepID=UPI0025B8D57A|nr:response regulator transcription factor [Chiayiivirga sp.]MCI1710551.1 response regulator transcription factor [Chiayiivirga sp.]MCI1728627.1 response regulator transcription factor [Chiayiivirga sp.]
MTVRQNLIGLLEDDPDQAALFRLWLESHGYATRLYPQAGEFRRKLGAESVDLLLLDWNLPDESGIEVLRALRASGVRLPVIFLTARNEEEDIVAGLRAGADDYLTKPPKQGELLARVGALLRRVGFQGEQAEDEDAQPYRIEVPKRRVSLNGREILLTEREFDLALFLFRRRGRVVSRDALLEGVWNIRGDVATRTVDTHVSRLRKKLELGGENGWRLNAVYQHGYRLEQA